MSTSASPGLLIAVIALISITAILGVVLVYMYQSYTALQTRYEALRGMYSSLQSQYGYLQSQYSNLQSQYNDLSNKYQTLQSRYATLQSQYNSLYSEYQALQSQYNALESNVGSVFASADSYYDIYNITPGSGVVYPIIVPNGYTATVDIYASSSNYLEVALFPVESFNSFMASGESLYSAISLISSSYVWLGYTISETMALKPGHYMVVVYVPASYNYAPANVTIEITTTLTPSS